MTWPIWKLGSADPWVPSFRSWLAQRLQIDPWHAPWEKDSARLYQIDCEHIEEYQRRKGLGADAVVGKWTWEWAQLEGYCPPIVSHIWLHGVKVDIGAPVVDTRRFGFERKLRAESKVKRVVVHDSITYSTSKMVDVLGGKNCGTHFAMDHAGVIWQTCDPQFITNHAILHNSAGIGIDVISPLYPSALGNKRNLHWKTPAAAAWAPAKHGRQYLRPTAAQVASMRVLIEVLCRSYGIPMTWPKERRTLVLGGFLSRVYAHGHLSGNRWDGYDMLDELTAAV